jgi:hypothetical protein
LGLYDDPFCDDFLVIDEPGSKLHRNGKPESSLPGDLISSKMAYLNRPWGPGIILFTAEQVE